MTVTLRPIFLGVAAAIAALVVSSCSSEDAGQSLQVSFPVESSFSVAKTSTGTAGSPFVPAIPATSTSPAVPAVPEIPPTPDTYTGTGTVVAKVIYKGEKELVYLWSVTLPNGVGGTFTTTEEQLSIDAKGYAAIGVPLFIGPLGGPGNYGYGEASLLVYEKDGTLSESAKTPILVVLGYSG